MENKFACNVAEMFLGAIVSKTNDIIEEVKPSFIEDLTIKLVGGDYLYIKYHEHEGDFYISYHSSQRTQYGCSHITVSETLFGYYTVRGGEEEGIKAIDHELGEDLAYSIYNRLKWTTLHV